MRTLLYTVIAVLGLTFAAPVTNSAGQVLAYWANFADFGLVEEIVDTFYQQLKDDGMAQAELTVLDPQGNVIVDYDPTVKGYPTSRATCVI